MRRHTARPLLAFGTALAWVLVFGAFGEAFAQSTTGTLRGFVRSTENEPIFGATVVAVQEGTNFTRSAITSESGFYSLVGLPPGQYTVTASMIGYGDQARSLRMLTGQTLTVDFPMSTQAIELAALVIEVEAVEMATPELATNITPQQVESMPLNDRNFLALAGLVPGVSFGCSGDCAPGDGGGLNVGAQSANQANVFVDGVSFKNDILKGGVAGQDASKGNPFPQVAVQELRVITQQYKAEYQRATSAIVSATTRSGTNDWEAELFGFRQHEGLIERDFFTLQNCRNRPVDDPCPPLPVQERWQFGGALGGPILRDRLFFFTAFEGNHQDRASTVQTTSAALDMWPDSIQTLLLERGDLTESGGFAQGTFPSEFRSDLYFGKLTWLPTDRQRVELSGTVRDEFDIRGFGGQESLENAENFNNDVSTFLLRHQYTLGNLLNEAQASYQTYSWRPEQLRTELVGLRFANTLKIGGRCCPQDQTQRRFQIRDDVSYSMPGWFGDHVFKVGGNVDFIDYDIIKQLNVNPQFTFEPADPNVPVRVNVGFGDPNIGAENTAFGAYLQDDWSLSQRLILNLGVRWDYESNAMNNDYVTPPEVIAELTPLMDSLIIINDDYFTDGDQRDPFMGAIQPRLGFSYDLTGQNETVLFGGWGIYYDRNPYATLIGERERLVWTTYEIRFSADGSVPGTVAWDESFFDRDVLESQIAAGTFGKPEVFLIDNNTRPPRTNQFSLGVRQAWEDFVFTLDYAGARSENNFTWMFANRNPDNRLFETPSFRNVLVSTDEGESWYDAVHFKAERHYTEDSPWSIGLGYTLSWADDNFGAGRDFAGLSFRDPSEFVRRSSERDQRHVVNANWILGLPFDFRFSGIVTLASARPYRVFFGGDPCTTGNMDCIGNEFPDGGGPDNPNDPTVWGGTNPFTGEAETFTFLGTRGWGFRNVDVRLEKFFEFRGNEISLIAEGFNIFDFDNFTFYDGRLGDLRPDGTVAPNPNFGNRNAVITDAQATGAPPRWQFGLRYSM